MHRWMIAAVLSLAGCANGPQSDGLAGGYFPGQSVDVVSGRLSSWCAERGLTVYASVPGNVVCGARLMDIPGAEMQAVFTQVLIGNAYSTPATIKIYFRSWADGGGTRVQVRQMLETTLPGGMTNQASVRRADETQHMNDLLRHLGAT